MPTLERIGQMRAALDAAGDQWAAVAAALPEIVEVLPGDDTMRDRCRLDGEVTGHGQPYPATLYRNELTGEWWATGWSGVSQAQVQRPGGWVYDEDAGVHVLASDPVQDRLAQAVKEHRHAREVEAARKRARDALIRQALAAGLSYAQVGEITGLGRAMLDRIRHSRA